MTERPPGMTEREWQQRLTDAWDREIKKTWSKESDECLTHIQRLINRESKR